MRKLSGRLKIQPDRTGRSAFSKALLPRRQRFTPQISFPSDRSIGRAGVSNCTMDLQSGFGREGVAEVGPMV